MPRTKSTKRLDRLVAPAGRGEAYQREADKMRPTNPAERATQKWMSGMAEHFRRQFACRLREEREKARMTQYALAKAADVDPAVVQRIGDETFRLFVPQELGHYVAEVVLDLAEGLAR